MLQGYLRIEISLSFRPPANPPSQTRFPPSSSQKRQKSFGELTFVRGQAGGGDGGCGSGGLDSAGRARGFGGLPVAATAETWS